jgi:hypothetical protein
MTERRVANREQDVELVEALEASDEAQEVREADDKAITADDLQEVLEAVETVDSSKYWAQVRLVRAVRKALGPARTGHRRNNRARNAKKLAAWLVEQGYDRYSPGYLRELAVVADAFPDAYLSASDKAVVPWTGLYKARYRPETISVLVDLQRGKHRREAMGVKVPHDGRTVSLLTAVQIPERGIRVSDVDALLKAIRDREQLAASSSTEPEPATEPAADPGSVAEDGPATEPAGEDVEVERVASAAQLDHVTELVASIDQSEDPELDVVTDASAPRPIGLSTRPPHYVSAAEAMTVAEAAVEAVGQAAQALALAAQGGEPAAEQRAAVARSARHARDCLDLLLSIVEPNAVMAVMAG